MGRQTVVVNLDPANECLQYPCAIDILDLIALPDVAEELRLGPNGGLVYCLEYLEHNTDWLEERLARFPGAYVLFDCPGQAELVTHHTALLHIARRLQKLDYRLVAVNLVDAHHTSDAGMFISAALLSLTAMIRLELPALHVLSKTDTVGAVGGPPAFDLDFYADVVDLGRLADTLRGGGGGGRGGGGGGDGADSDGNEVVSADGADDGGGDGGAPRRPLSAARPVIDLCPPQEPEPEPEGQHGGDGGGGGGRPRLGDAERRAGEAHRAAFAHRYHRLNAALAEIVEDHALLAFIPMSVTDAHSVERVVAAADRAGGYVALARRGAAARAASAAPGGLPMDAGAGT